MGRKRIPIDEPVTWHRHPLENQRQFQAFITYARLGFGRTHQKVAEQLSVTLPRVLAVGTCFRRQERVSLFDAEHFE